MYPFKKVAEDVLREMRRKHREDGGTEVSVQPKARDPSRHQKPGKAKNRFFLRVSVGTVTCRHPDFRLGLPEIKFLLLEATQFVVVCYGRPRTPTQMPTHSVESR